MPSDDDPGRFDTTEVKRWYAAFGWVILVSMLTIVVASLLEAGGLVDGDLSSWLAGTVPSVALVVIAVRTHRKNLRSRSSRNETREEQRCGAPTPDRQPDGFLLRFGAIGLPLGGVATWLGTQGDQNPPGVPLIAIGPLLVVASLWSLASYARRRRQA